MRIKEHKTFGHGLREGTNYDMNCLACRREQDQAVLTEARKAMEGALPALILLGDYIGNQFDGKLGYAPFDRCQVIMNLHNAITAVNQVTRTANDLEAEQSALTKVVKSMPDGLLDAAAEALALNEPIEITQEGTVRKTCSCGGAWADEPGHDHETYEPDGNDQPLTPDEIAHEARYGGEPDEDDMQDEVPVVFTRAEWIRLHDFLKEHDEPQGIAQAISDQLEG